MIPASKGAGILFWGGWIYFVALRRGRGRFLASKRATRRPTTNQTTPMTATKYTTEFRKGSHFINLSATQSVPFGIAMLATGGNKWMRKAESTCPKCNGRFTAEHFDGNAYCQECVIAELAIA